MTWLYLAIASYFILAAVNITDSFLLKKVIDDERVYTFLIGALGLVVLFAIPFADFSKVGVGGFYLNIIAGISFAFALILFFSALKNGEASVVVPFIGGGVPIIVTIASFIFLHEQFTGIILSGIILLLIGGVVMTLIPKQTRHWWNIFKKDHPLGIGKAIISIILFAIFFVISKHAYDTQGFLGPFIIARVGTFIGVVWLLFDKKFRKHVGKFIKKTLHSSYYVYYINQFFGAIGFLGLNIAISLHSVTIINALQGIQYVFVLILASILTLKYPKMFKENITRRVILEKSFAVILIAVGLSLIAFNQ